MPDELDWGQGRKLTQCGHSRCGHSRKFGLASSLPYNSHRMKRNGVMDIRISLCIALLIWPPSLFADANWDDLNSIQELTEQGRYKEALNGHILFFEETRDSSSMAGVIFAMIFVVSKRTSSWVA